MKVLIVAGGGGHFAPALAVIEALPKDWDFLIVGRKYAFEGDKALSLEYQTSQKLGYKFEPLVTGRLQRKFNFQSLTSLAKVPGGFVQALNILKKYQPDVVLTFGGYVSIPVVLAAKTLGLPIVVHEQILSAGLANKIAAKFAQKICVSWEESKKFFPKEKVVLTGNPVRKFQILNFKFPILNAGLPVIYITGGSGGAHAINVLVENCLDKLLTKYVVIHQTGDAQEFKDFARLEKKKESLPQDLQSRYLPVKFVASNEVFSILKQASLVVSRSGINTLTELITFGKPCLLIPLPFGQKNEQAENAQFLKELGLAEVANQEDLTSDALCALIDTMFQNLKRYESYSQDAKKLIIPDAAAKVVATLKDVNSQTTTKK